MAKETQRTFTPQKGMGSRDEKRGDVHTPKGAVVCSICHNVYFKKEWHHPTSSSAGLIRSVRHGVTFKVCPACTMARTGQYEGEILIQNVPPRYEAELMHIITKHNAKAQVRDPQDRVLSIEKTKAGYRVTTSENQLAVRLGKKIKGVFNKVDLEISYAKDPYELVRLKLSFL